MRRSLKTLAVTVVVAVATVGLTGFAAADETTGDGTHTIADGAYTLTLPGIGATLTGYTLTDDTHTWTLTLRIFDVGHVQG